MNLRHQQMLAALAVITASHTAAAQDIGPSTGTEPYLLPSISGVVTTSILTTGDSVGGYRMVGIPDGLGAWRRDEGDHNRSRHRDGNNGKGHSFNLVMHHELGRTSGFVRAHGSPGAFVSRWSIDRETLEVLSGRDQVTSPDNVFTRNGAGYTAGTTAWDRLCSADLADQDAFWQHGHLGTRERIFLSGEETSPPFSNVYGRLFANVLTGSGENKAYELPRLGKMSFENALASPFRQSKTVVMLKDDAGIEPNVTTANVCTMAGQQNCMSPPSEVYMYVGTKQSSGNDIERAGLTNGNFYGLRVRVNGMVVTGENKDFVFRSSAPAVTSARFEFVNFGNVSNKTGQEIQNDSITNQVMQFMRVEDGQWDPRKGKERDYYFVTTGAISNNAATWRPSRLWRLRFDDISRPQAGGTITMLLTNAFYPGAATTPDADPNYQMLDNITIDGDGRIILQEDPGSNNRLSRVYVYGIDSGELVQVAAHNPKFFSPGIDPANFQTNNEESSGVIDASDFLGDGWFLMSVQNHRASADPELVEGGQLNAVYIDPKIARKSRGRH